MKIRNGFVSNSSSSSFVLIGKEINYNDYLDIDKKNDIVFFGDYIYEGFDVFKINEKIENILPRLNPNKYKLYLSYYFNDAQILSKETIEKLYETGMNFEIINGDADYHSSDTDNVSNEEIIERYS